ncbi:hypothetical protein GM3708_1903 [Geminocystis sp. NIES-3708]|nr:hypothetical protein GM3708_1903 [Geminocystis sp. NIES-3708]
MQSQEWEKAVEDKYDDSRANIICRHLLNFRWEIINFNNHCLFPIS